MNSPLEYDEPRLTAELAAMSPSSRALFAAATAERLRPAYWHFHELTGQGSLSVFDNAMYALWSSIAGESVDLASQLTLVDELSVAEEDDWIIETGLAENAVSGVVYAIKSCLTGESQYAAWAARQNYEALDLWVRMRDDIDFNVEGAEGRVLADPLVQGELVRQRRDVEELIGVPEGQVAALTTRFRKRAQAEGLETFDSLEK